MPRRPLPAPTQTTDATGSDQADTGASLASFVDGWRDRALARGRAESAFSDQLLAALPAMVDCLRLQFGATRVVLFGSLARGEATLGSDVDLLVDGLAPTDLVAAAVALERRARPAHVDLVPAQSARPEVLDRALREGKVLLGH